MQKIFYFILLCCSCLAEEPPACNAILEYSQSHFQQCGELKQTNGFVYVDVDDEYIHTLIKMIEAYGFREPPYFNRADLVGAHITVIYPEEMCSQKISECGKIIEFSLEGCSIVHPKRTFNTVYFIRVAAPELDEIRTKYGLPKRDFHITIGIKD